MLWSHGNGDLVPANEDAIVLEEVVITQAAVVDVDVPAVEASGTFLLDGAHPPYSVYENGRVSLRDPRTGDVIDLGDTRDGTWSKVLVPGTYDVLYSKLLGGDIVPANPLAVIATGFRPSGVRSTAIDIPTVRLVGEYSLDGAPFPVGYYDNARIWLQGEEEADLFDVGMTVHQTYETRVIPGTYAVVYEGLGSTGLMPENEWTVISTGNTVARPIFGDVDVLDVAVESGFLTADVTMWGEAPPQGVYENGDILAVDADGEATLVGMTMDGGGTVRLVAGDYDLHYSRRLGDIVPINGDARVGEGTASGLLMPASVDLRSGWMSGVFKQGGASFPVFEDEYGRIALRDRVTGDRIELGATQAGSYGVELLEGVYDVLYDYVEGDSIVENMGATVGCVTFAPLDPTPAEAPTRASLGAYLQR